MEKAVATEAKINIPDRNGAKLWALTAMVVFFVYFFTAFQSIGPSIDGCTYATAARSLLRGDGAIYGWIATNSFADYAPGSHLEIHNSLAALPKFLWPGVIALFFLIFGIGDSAVALAGGACYIAAAPIVYFLGRRHFSALGGHLAAGLYVFNAMILGYTLTGMTENLFFLLTFAALWFALDRKHLASAGLFGLMVGLGVLTKTSGSAWMAPLFFLLWPEKKGRWSRIAIALAVVISIWLVSTKAIYPAMNQGIQPPQRQRADLISEKESSTQKTPQAQAPQSEPTLFDRLVDGPLRYVVLLHSSRYPEHSSVRGLDHPVPSQVIREDMDGFYQRIKWNLALIAKAFFWNSTSPILLWLFWAGIVLFLIRPGLRALGLATLAMLAGNGILHALTFAWARYFHPAIPLMIFIAAGVVVKALQTLPNMKRPGVIAAVVVIACSIPVGFTAGIDALIPISSGHTLQARNQDALYYSQLSRLVQDNVAPGETIACDIAGYSAWYGDRPTVLLPNDPNTLDKLLDIANVDYVLLVFQFQRKAYNEAWRKWLLQLKDHPENNHGLVLKAGQPTRRGTIYLFKTPVTYK